jgi:hypothetical protein
MSSGNQKSIEGSRLDAALVSKEPAKNLIGQSASQQAQHLGLRCPSGHASVDRGAAPVSDTPPLGNGDAVERRVHLTVAAAAETIIAGST